MDKILHLIPTQPETYLLHWGLSKEALWIGKSLVIGWAHVDGKDYEPLCLEPVTLSGVRDGCPTQDFAILLPDGTVTVPHDTEYASLDLFSEWAEKDARREA